MTTFYYSATFDESVELLRGLCAQGHRIIVHDVYDGPVAPEHGRVTDVVVEHLSRAPGFSLVGAFSRFPPVLTRLEGGPAAGRYVVDDLAMGPLLEGVVARVARVDGVPTTLLGWLTCQSRHKHPETGRWEKASPDVKAAYRRAVTQMKKSLVVEPPATMPIGPAALALVRSGAARLRERFGTPSSP